MSFREKALAEVKAIALVTAFFAAWFCVLVFLKSLILADYQIQFRGLSVALIGALIVAKVVLILEHVSLGAWVRRHPVALEVVLRTLLYAVGVVIVMLLEKAFESRAEHGGFTSALVNVFEHRDILHVWASAIGVTSALLVFNAAAVLREHFGGHSLAKVFFSPPASDNREGSHR